MARRLRTRHEAAKAMVAAWKRGIRTKTEMRSALTKDGFEIEDIKTWLDILWPIIQVILKLWTK